MLKMYCLSIVGYYAEMIYQQLQLQKSIDPFASLRWNVQCSSFEKKTITLQRIIGKPPFQRQKTAASDFVPGGMHWFCEQSLDQHLGSQKNPEENPSILGCPSSPSHEMLWLYLGVSKNRGIPKSFILIGFSLINHPFWDTPVFGHTHLGSMVHHSQFW